MTKRQMRVAKEFEEFAETIKRDIEEAFGRNVTWPEVTRLIAIQEKRRIAGNIIISPAEGGRRKRKESHILLSLG